MFCEGIRIKQGLSYILLIKDSLQQQIHFNGNSFVNKCCRYNKGSQSFKRFSILTHISQLQPIWKLGKVVIGYEDCLLTTTHIGEYMY